MEPEKPIERLLRETAEKRRAEANKLPPLHPANRRLLQGEVSRTYRAKPVRNAFFALLWPQVGWSFAVLAGVGLAASMMLPRDRERSMTLADNRFASAARGSASAPRPVQEHVDNFANQPATAGRSPAKNESERRDLALNDNFKEADAAKNLQPAAAAAPSPVVTADHEDTSQAFRKRYGLQPPPAAQSRLAGNSASTPSAPPKPSNKQGLAADGASAGAVTLKSDDQSAARSLIPLDAARQSADRMALADQSKAKASIASSPALATVTEKDALADASLNKKSFDVLRQKFVQVNLPTSQFRARPAGLETNVLTRFEVRQSGGAITIIDDDGSVYYAASPVAVEAPRSRTESVGIGDKAQSNRGMLDAVISGGTYPLNVTGTNRTLQQTIVFRGQMKLPSGLSAKDSSTFRFDTNAAAGTNWAAQRVRTLTNAEITGNVIIGNGGPVPIRAEARNSGDVLERK